MPVPTKTPTKQELKDFRAYVKVQRSNQYNMLTPDAIQATGLGKERHMHVITNYDWLASYSPEQV
jgi:hypothetical protein